MSALRMMWGNALRVQREVVSDRRSYVAAKPSHLNQSRLNHEGLRLRRIESWGKRRWPPTPSDAELIALATANMDAATRLCMHPPPGLMADMYPIVRRAQNELAQVIALVRPS